MKKAIASTLFIVMLGGCFFLSVKLASRKAYIHTEPSVLYIPKGKYMKIMSLSYDNLVADLLYLWTIQYTGQKGIDKNYNQIKHIYEVITDLDPAFLDAYYIGAMIMVLDAGNVEDSLELLDKGIKKNPDEYMLAVEAAFYCYNNKKYLKAAEYFEKAIKMDDSEDKSSFPRRMYAAMFEKAEKNEKALKYWKEVHRNAAEDRIKRISGKHIFNIKTKIDIKKIKSALSEYKKDRGEYPKTLKRLVEAGYLNKLPVDPRGHPYIYDPGELEIKPGSKFKYTK